MDLFAEGCDGCSNPRNIAAATSSAVSVYWNFAKEYAMSDNYFHSMAGASEGNDIYFIRGSWKFNDNDVSPLSPTLSTPDVCEGAPLAYYDDPTIGSLLKYCGVSWSWYGEGYGQQLADPGVEHCWPEYYDPGDNPFQYFRSFADVPEHNRDYTQFKQDVETGDLPMVSFLKLLGMHSEHPGVSNITTGAYIVQDAVDAVLKSPKYAENTLVLLVPDESGGYYDHVPPPPDSTVDSIPYGLRVWFLAVGHFARKNYISHIELEHASITKFLEWNYLGGHTGQLGTRDAVVNNIGSVLDASKVGTALPE